ncbi:hypothetical protein [Ureibacillus sp. GCM10028918]|uniref:hypothetical protein n=1 Tax=Ureibacillus sp. GCM10028918 TaxID=3273429 RepID=UPI00360F7C29
METTQIDYNLLLEMVEDKIRDQVNELKTKRAPYQNRLFNAGQIRAFEHVLSLLAVNDDTRQGN